MALQRCAAQQQQQQQVPPSSAGAAVPLWDAAALPGLLANTSVSTALLMRDIVLQDSHFDVLDSLPVVLKRSFTIDGTYGSGVGGGLPAVDMNFVARKIQLSGHVAFTFRRVTLYRFRSLYMRQAPGMDLIADGPPTPPGEAPPAVVVDRGDLVYAICLPIQYEVRSLVSIVRPAAFPGNQSFATIPNPPLLGPNCTNASLLAPGAVAVRDRCYNSRTWFLDLSTSAQSLDARGEASPSNYDLWVVGTWTACMRRIPVDCVETYGFERCYLMYPIVQLSALPAPPPVPSGGSGGVQLEVLLPALLGGLALLIALLVGAAWLVRSGRRRASRPKAAEPMGGSPEDPCPEVAQLGSSSQGKDPGLTALHSSAYSADSGDGSSGLPEPGKDADSGALAGHAQHQQHEQRIGVAAGHIRMQPEQVHVAVVTRDTPHREGVRLDLRWGVDVLADPAAELGAGSFARVVLGTFEGRRVAVKTIKALSGAARAGRASERVAAAHRVFQQEAEVLSRCCHPNVVQLLGACMEPPYVCLVMDVMEQSLEQLLRNGDVPLQQALRIGLDVAHGLAYLHPTIVHRDLKPANILLDAAGNAKITDFGLARLRSTVAETAHPEAGTAPYMAPECFAVDNFTITHKADMYSFAVMLWEVLTGCIPWAGTPPLAVAFAIASGSRLPLGALQDEAYSPPRLARLLAGCWDADPQRRPSAADAVKELLLVQQELARRPPLSCREAQTEASLPIAGSGTTAAYHTPGASELSSFHSLGADGGAAAAANDGTSATSGVRNG